MMKRKHLLIFFIIILLILSIQNVAKAAADYATIIRGNDNQWIVFPSKLTKSWTTNWDGYYIWNGKLENKSTSENVTFQIQYLCIERTEVDKIQEKSDETPEDSVFNQWLNSWAVNLINEESWTTNSNMKIELECKLGENVEHEHLVFVKVLENSSASIVWNGYGEGFSRISESRKKVNLESIEVTTPPKKIDYEEGEMFDNEGMVINAKYSDGSSKVVTNYTYTPQTALKITDTAITIVYAENNISKEVSQEITVTEKANEETKNDTNKAILVNIEITTPPTKIVYEEGESFDNAGMVITAKYSDGSSKVVKNYTYTPQTALKITDTEITIVYAENNISKEAHQDIKVEEKEDTTTATGEIPQTGEKIGIIFALIGVIIIGVVIYSKYRKMKDIL